MEDFNRIPDVIKILQKFSHIPSWASQDDHTTDSGSPQFPDITFFIIIISTIVFIPVAKNISTIGFCCCHCDSVDVITVPSVVRGKNEQGIKQNSRDDSENDDGKHLTVNQTDDEILKQLYTKDLILFCSEYYNDYEVYETNIDGDTKPITIDDALSETFLKENQTVLLIRGSLRLKELTMLYNSFICKWINGEILKSYKVIRNDVSQQNDLLTVVNRSLSPSDRLTSLTDLKEKHILLLLEGFTTNTKEYNIVKDLLELNIKNLPNLFVWSTEKIWRDMVEIEISLKDR